MAQILNDCDLAYVAGFFDGEGSIGAYQRNYRRANGERTSTYEFYLQFGNNDAVILRWIQGFFATGKVRLLKGTKCYVLEVRCRPDIEMILRSILKSNHCLVVLHVARQTAGAATASTLGLAFRPDPPVAHHDKSTSAERRTTRARPPNDGSDQKV